MNTMYWREHEFGPDEPPIRVWSDMDAGYGSFNVMSYNDFKLLEKLFVTYGWTLIRAKDD